jgi:Uma2 family endonuclease
MNVATLERPTEQAIAERGETLSYQAFLDQLDEDVRAEWVNGEVLFMSPVSDRHQQVGGFLVAFFKWYLDDNPIGKLFYESYQMKTGPDLPGREPDLIFLANEHMDRNRHTYIDGPGDIVVEIVSLESRQRDRAEKFYEYEQGGVREYWLIDPTCNRADFFVLDAEGKYAAATLDAEGFYASAALPGLRIKPMWFWQEPMPPLRATLKEAGIGL